MKTKPPIVINDRSRIAFKSDGTKIPVIDSKLTTTIQPEPEDIKNGVPGDHANCMYCLACKRLFKSELVWVTRTIAYVELKGKGGKPELHRFILSTPAQVAVGEFDAEKDVTPEAISFVAPTGTRTLDYYRSPKRRAAKAEKGKAYVVGKKKNYPQNPARPQRPETIGERLRKLREPAYGMFHFTPQKA
jgi:hypothetical protein